MKPIELAVRCTREEYMEYAAENGKKHLWTVPLGFVLLAGSIVSCVFVQQIQAASLVWFLCGMVLLLLDPLILPMIRKGEAARLYDRSESLQGAITLKLDDTGITVRSVTTEAVLPPDAVTEMKLTSRMVALCFGNTLTVCIPKRVLQDEELTALTAFLTQIIKKESDI